MYNCKSAVNEMNELGKERTPFLFIFDFLCKSPIVINLNKVNDEEILYSLNGISNTSLTPANNKQLNFGVVPAEKARYEKAFQKVQHHIHHGDSFLLNLTMPSKIESNYSLKDIFFASKAKYKLWLKDTFVVFSPEIFVQTNKNTISSFPMKGTIDARLPNAEELLLKSEKELAEHFTIVDLIRNDLSMISKEVKVEKFRFIDKIKTNKGDLLQMSSEIKGKLPANWQNNIGTIIGRMLPAGSISGAPKKKTLEIIQETEQYDRGFYTGIFGVFDGENIDSGVMIRFVEQTKSGMIYKSGGGITAKSNLKEEYEELIQKVYIPI
jgi:para-aminobenzoate synthetase component 1